MTRSLLTFLSFDYSLQDDIIVFKSELFSYFNMVNLFDPCDPYMTFEVKLLIIFVATYPLVILTNLHDHAT